MARRLQERRKTSGRRMGTRSAATFRPPIAITGFSPAFVAQGSGAVSPLNVLGYGFTGSTVAHFNGAIVPTTYVNANLVQISVSAATVLVPGFYPVFLSDVSYPAASTVVVWPVAYPVPTLQSVAPTFAYLREGNATPTATGTGFFVSGTDATVDTVDSAFSYASATSGGILVAQASYLQEAGSHALAIRNPAPGGGLTAPQNFDARYRTPVLSTTSTTLIPIYSGDYPVDLGGSAYYDAAAFLGGGSVGWIDGVAAATTFLSSTALRIIVPAAVTSVPGNKSITVTNPTAGSGGGVSAPIVIAVSNPTVTSIATTNTVRFYDGFTQNLTGTDFSSTDRVKFRGAFLATTFNTSTSLTAIVPASLLGFAGTANFTVVTTTGYETNGVPFTTAAWDVPNLGAKLTLWITGSSLVDDGTGHAATWTDLAWIGNWTQATSAKRPLITTCPALNNAPAAYFTNALQTQMVGRSWTGTASGNVPMATTNNVVIYAVSKVNDPGFGPAVFGDIFGVFNSCSYQNGVISGRNDTGGGATFVTPAYDTLHLPGILWTHRRLGGTPGTHYGRVNSTAARGAYVSASTGNGTLGGGGATAAFLGSLAAGSLFFQGWVTDAIVLNADTTPTEDMQLQNRASFLYGIAYV